MATIFDGELVFSTGKRVDVSNSAIGIDDTLDPSYGYDGGIAVVDWIDLQVILSHAERKELAEYAISLWKRFAALTDDELINMRPTS